MCSWKEWRYNKFLFVTQDNLTHSSKCTFICLVTLLSGRKKNTWREFIVYNQGEMSADEVFFLLCLDMSTKWGGGGEKKSTFYCHMSVKIVLKLSIIMAFHAAIFKKMRPNLVKFATTPHSKKKLSCHLVSCRKKNDRNSVSNMEVVIFSLHLIAKNNKSHRSREIAMWYLQYFFSLLFCSFLLFFHRLTHYSSWRLLTGVVVCME